MAAPELSEDQMADLKECYMLFDKKGDDKVDSSDLIRVLQASGLNPITSEVVKVVKDSDLENKRVEFETFYSIYHQFSTKQGVGSTEDMVEGLKTFDRDQSGMINGAELRHILTNLADKMTEDQVEAIITPHEDANGQVPYEQLIKFVMASE